MKVKWGKKNESVTFYITGEPTEQHDEKLFLSILEKQVCDREILRQVVRARIGEAQAKMHAKCLEVVHLKEQLESKSIWRRIVRFFLSPGGLIMKGI